MKSTKMTRKKAIVTAAISLIFCAILLCCYFLLPFWVYRPAKSTAIIINRAENRLVADKNQVKILQLTDVHVNGALDVPITFSVMKQTVYETEPDLIVLTGDLFRGGCSEKNVRQLITFMDKLGLPWAAVLGNHDYETPYSLQQLSSILETGERSLFQTGNVPNMYGNYAYDLSFQDGNLFQLIFMDSRSAGFTQDSVAFYESTVTASKARTPGGEPLDNFLFYHIPLTEENAAIQAWQSGAASGFGILREPACVQETDVGFFDKVLELNATKAMMFGHDHVNNAVIHYQGVDFCYGTKTGTTSYNDMDLLGGTLYTLNSSGAYTIEHVYC